MGSPRWPDVLRVELAKKKLPKEYVQRLMEELQDHLEDLKKESSGMDAQEFETMGQRIGSPKQIANAAAAEYRKGSFFSRHPVMTFVVAPIPLLILSWIAFLAIVWLIGASMPMLGARRTGWTTSSVSWPAVAALWIFYVVWVLGPFAVTAWILSYVASRSGRSGLWSLTACLIVALVAWISQTHLVLPIEPGTGKFELGFGFPPWGIAAPSAAPEAVHFSMRGFFGGQFIQCLVPLAIGLGFFWRSSRSIRFGHPTR